MADLKRDFADEAIGRLRVGGLVLLAVQFINIAADFYAKPGFAGRFAAPHLENALLLLLFIGLTWTRLFARAWQMSALIACTALLASGTAMSIVSRDVLPRLVSVIIFSLGCATFLPWSGFYQGLLNLMCIASFAIDIAYVGLPREGIYLWVGFGTVIVLSQFIAVYSNRFREQLLANAKELAQRDAVIQSSRLKSQFLSTLTHEIRTPVHIILTCATAIESQIARLQLPGNVRAIKAIRNAGYRLSLTIDRILDMSRMEEGGFEVHPAALDIARLARDVIDEFNPSAEEKGLLLTFETREQNPLVLFDEYCFTQSLTNLLENAIKFTDHGSITVRLFPDSAGRLNLEVSDTGAGIDPAFLPRLFEPFSQEQTEYSRRFKGTGLGLALVKRYLALNDGEISVNSERGQGTTFTIRFPAP